MEKAPWKLTQEMVDVMGGVRSHYYEEYVSRCIMALKEARRHAEQMCVLMETMSYKSNYPAFRYNSNAIAEFRARLLLHTPDSELRREVEGLISKSFNHGGTSLYDRFQLQTNGIVI
jgi:phosphatidylinositol 4-kinase B